LTRKGNFNKEKPLHFIDYEGYKEIRTNYNKVMPMSFLIEGEQITMKIHTSRITHFKFYLISVLMVFIPISIALLNVKLPIPSAFANYVYFGPVAFAVVLLAILEMSVRRSTSYITNYRVISTKGILKRTYDSCNYDKMVNVRVVQSFPQRILRIGTVDITTFQRSEIMLEHVSNPTKIEKAIYNMIEKNRQPVQAAPSVQAPALPPEADLQQGPPRDKQ
jgi:uncharacterized membrane protein YdbT with pleckstrin-like domain